MRRTTVPLGSPSVGGVRCRWWGRLPFASAVDYRTRGDPVLLYLLSGVFCAPGARAEGVAAMAIERVRAYFEPRGSPSGSSSFPHRARRWSSRRPRWAASPRASPRRSRLRWASAWRSSSPPATRASTIPSSRRSSTPRRRCSPPRTHERASGTRVGGVCPFAVNDGCDVYLDASLRRFDTVYPACGSANSAIGLTLAELERYARPVAWIDVCKLPA